MCCFHGPVGHGHGYLRWMQYLSVRCLLGTDAGYGGTAVTQRFGAASADDTRIKLYIECCFGSWQLGAACFLTMHRVHRMQFDSVVCA